MIQISEEEREREKRSSSTFLKRVTSVVVVEISRVMDNTSHAPAKINDAAGLVCDPRLYLHVTRVGRRRRLDSPPSARRRLRISRLTVDFARAEILKVARIIRRTRLAPNAVIATHARTHA